MRKMIILVSLTVIAFGSSAGAQGRSSGDRALGPELNRDKAETRIERLRQDQRQKEERPAARAQKLPPEGSIRPQLQR